MDWWQFVDSNYNSNPNIEVKNQKVVKYWDRQFMNVYWGCLKYPKIHATNNQSSTPT